MCCCLYPPAHEWDSEGSGEVLVIYHSVSSRMVASCLCAAAVLTLVTAHSSKRLPQRVASDRLKLSIHTSSGRTMTQLTWTNPYVDIYLSNEELPIAMVNHLLLVEHVDIMIGALIGFIVFLRLPRALARLWKKSERYNGHFIWCNARKAPESPCAISKEPAFASGGRSVNSAETLRSSCPPHIPAYPVFLYPFMGPLRRSIAFGYSNLQISTMLAYLAIMLYTFSYRSNFLNTPIRSAYIAAAQLPFLYAFAAKNGIPGSLLGMGYQSLNFLHRYIGCIIVLASNVHSIGLFYRWTNDHTIRSEFQGRSNRWGLVVLIFVDIIFVFSTSYWRKRAYNIFRFTHIVGYLFIIPALYFHEPTSLPFIVAASLIYLVDRALRLLKTRLATATVRPLPALEATRIEIPSLNGGWRAGQHVRLRVLSTSLGWFGWMELHPFTIASAPASSASITGDEGLVLICKKTGSWTSKLFEMTKAFRATESGSEAEMNIERSVNVLIEGPYGGPGHTIFASYSAMFLVTGGSGITFALSTIQELVQKGLRGESSIKVIELVWVSQNPDAITPLLPVFASLANSCSYLTISMHYTRSRTPASEVKTELSSLLSSHEVFPSGLNVHPGRPGRGHLTSMMESVIVRATGDPNGTTGVLSQRGLLVGICGPQGMSQSVCAAVADIDQKMVRRIGGVEAHQECFEF
ncbi:hypothetical protein APHAL10511_007755 [Amanita phalloides]|nr:hypothetical protein APHAL10511_007755 [Amanita phalloides]